VNGNLVSAFYRESSLCRATIFLYIQKSKGHREMIIEVTREDQITMVETLAEEIWTEHYTPIIGNEQLRYMLDKFQSKDAISVQIKDERFSYFLIVEEGEYIGYLAVQSKGEGLFLSKIYIKRSKRERGFAKKAVQFLEDFARDKNLKKFSLQ
jgi:diamine N-acetyltransferase